MSSSTMARLALAVGLASSTTARADEAAERYKELIQEGLAEFETEHYAEALTLFRQAYDVRPTAKVLRAIAKAHYELSQYTECVEICRQSLASRVDPLDAGLRKDVQALLERAQRYVGTLKLTLQPPDARVTVDGRGVEYPDEPIGLNIGSHVLAVQAEGFEPFEQVVDVEGNKVLELTVQLEPEQEPEALPPSITQVETQPPGERSNAPLILGAGLTAVGVGGGIASLIWFLDRNSAIDDCNDAAALGLRCGNADDISDQRDLAVILMAVSGGVAVVGGTIMAVHLATAPSKPRPEVACAPSLDGGAMCHAAIRF